MNDPIKLLYSLEDVCCIAATLALNRDSIAKTFRIVAERFFDGESGSINRAESVLYLIERVQWVCKWTDDKKSLGEWPKEWVDKIYDSYATIAYPTESAS
jgi:hypothetical protein